MRAIVVVFKVVDEADFSLLMGTPLLDELLGTRLVLTCAGAADGPALPAALAERGMCMRLCAVQLLLRHAPTSDKESKALFRKLRLRSEGYWGLVTGLHLPHCDVGREALTELQELLSTSGCALKALSVSHTSVDAWPLLAALRANASVTSLDVRHVPQMRSLYASFAQSLVDAQSLCRVEYLRCDAFELLEGATSLSLKETLLSDTAMPGALALLAGLLRNNSTLLDLDLTATDLDASAAAALVAMLESNTTLATLRLPFNPALDDAAKGALRAAAEAREPPLTLEL